MKTHPSSKVPCFGSDPRHDIELMRKMRIAQLKREHRKGVIFHFGLYTSSAVVMGFIARKIWNLFTH